MVSLNTKVQNSIEFKETSLFGDEVVKVPLPPGDWQVRIIKNIESKGSNPVLGKMLWLDQVIDDHVVGFINMQIYPHGRKNWAPGERCMGPFLSRERGSSFSGYCHSLSMGKLMADFKSENQGLMRSAWMTKGITWPFKSVWYKSYFESQGRFTVYLAQSMSLSQIGLPRELEEQKSDVENWWKSNLNSPSVSAVTKWFEAYGEAVAAAVEGKSGSIQAAELYMLKSGLENLKTPLPEKMTNDLLRPSEVKTSVSLNDEVKNFIDFKGSGSFGDSAVRVPLPPGNWKVRVLDNTKSTHAIPINGIFIGLDNVVDDRVENVIRISVFPNNKKDWNPGRNQCIGEFFSRERGKSISGYCHSIRPVRLMGNFVDRIWQEKIRNAWIKNSINWPDFAVQYNSYYEADERFTIYLNHAVSLPKIGLPDDLVKSKSDIENWWKSNLNSPSVSAVTKWFEAYGEAVAAAVEGKSGDEQALKLAELTKLKSGFENLRVAQSVTQPSDSKRAGLIESLPTNPSITAETKLPAREVEKLVNEVPKDQLLIAQRQSQEVEESKRKQEELEVQLLAAQRKAQDAELAIREQALLAQEANQKEQARLAQEAKQIEQERLLADQKVKEQLQAAEEIAKANAIELAKLKEEMARMNLQKQQSLQSAPSSRKALVIGNDSYDSVPKLVNARQDAEAVGRTLEDLGYKVTLKKDLNQKNMKAALRQFKNDVEGGDEVVIFYAGHGVQMRSTNYLLPIDIKGDSEDQVKDDAIQLQRLLDDMNDKKVKLTLAMIDACRDNPFPKAGRAIGSRGLAPTTAATGQMIIFSAGSGQQALDKLGPNDKNPNGLFTRMLLNEMIKPGVRVDNMIRDVRRNVVAAAKSVGHEQVPAIYDQVVGDFYFTK